MLLGTLSEVEDAISDFKKNKSPGFDGLTPEFYNSVSDLLGGDLVEVINDQLARLFLIENDLEGAMRLISNVEGVPLVTELRPITLLNTSYKLLSRILSKRLGKFLESSLRSVQSCSKPGDNICSSAMNLISTVESVARQLKGKGEILSLDLLKAYDRVNLSYLQQVMEAMNILIEFVSMVFMLHEGATTRLLLDFISKPIDLTFSVRQGDPIAMILFLLYVEPLLLCMEDVTTGVSLVARQERTVQAKGVVGVVEIVEGFMDDHQAICGSLEDITNIDHLLRRFELVSGVILNLSQSPSSWAWACGREEHNGLFCG